MAAPDSPDLSPLGSVRDLDTLRALTDTIAAHSGARRAVLEQHYCVAAVMIAYECADGSSHDVLVEVLHEPGAEVGRRWMATATDSLAERIVGPCYAQSVDGAVGQIDWSVFVDSASPIRRGDPRQ